jgi:hypothetical protein
LRPSGARPRPLLNPPPPHQAPILPPIMSSSLQALASPCTLFHRESTAIGTFHSFDILGEYLHANSVSPFLERVGTGPTLHTSHSLIVLQHSEPIKEGAVQPPLPRPTNFVRPAGEPPHLWNLVPSTEGASCKDGAALSEVNITCPPVQSGARVVAQQQGATLAQSGVSTVEETRNPRKCEAADQLIGTRKAAKTMQGSAFEHVERKPKKSKILWANPVSVEFVTCPTRGVFKGIDGVESILRNKYLRVDPLAQHNIRSDNKDSSNESDHQAEHGTNSSQQAFPANLIDIIRAIREEAIPAPTSPQFMFEPTYHTLFTQSAGITPHPLLQGKHCYWNVARI